MTLDVVKITSMMRSMMKSTMREIIRL